MRHRSNLLCLIRMFICRFKITLILLRRIPSPCEVGGRLTRLKTTERMFNYYLRYVNFIILFTYFLIKDQCKLDIVEKLSRVTSPDTWKVPRLVLPQTNYIIIIENVSCLGKEERF